MIDIDPMLVVTNAVIFLVMIKVLNAMLFKPLTVHMDARKKSIQDGLGSADQNTKEVDALKAKADEIIHNAKKEAAQIKQNAIESAKVEADKKISLKRDEIAQDYINFESDLKTRKVELKNSLLNQAPLFKQSLKAKFASAA